MVALRRELVAVLAFACGGPRGPSSPAGLEPQAQIKMYAPLGARDDARQPHQAVVLGTDERDGSTLLQLSPATGGTVIDATYLHLGNGAATTIALATAPSAANDARVDDAAGGGGAPWRAGVWSAALVATTALDKDVGDFAFAASPADRIDGSAPSAAIAAGFVAAMTGTRVDSHAAVTGTIAPDGSIAPAAGLPEQILAAIVRGKNKVGFPTGMRMAPSKATGSTVDLVVLARSHGAEAIELADVRDAFRLLTGKTLPAPVPLTTDDMALDARTAHVLETHYKEWQQQLATEWATIVELDSAGRLPPLLRLLRDDARQHAERAEQLHQRGLVAAAYTYMLAAWAFAASTTQTYDVLSNIRAGDLTGAAEALDQLVTRPPAPADVLREIGRGRPSTLGGHLAMMGAFQVGFESWVFDLLAARATAGAKTYLAALAPKPAAELGSPAIADEAVGVIAPVIVAVARRAAGASLAEQMLELEQDDRLDYTGSVPHLRRVAAGFRSAAAASLRHVDARLVGPLATSAGVSEDVARDRLAMVEPSYLTARFASQLDDSRGLPIELRAEWGEQSLTWTLMSLAVSELAYRDAAALLVKHAAFDVRADPSGKIDAIVSEQALADMLVTAERHALANARAARVATGAVPLQAKLAYQLAMVEKEGDLGDRLSALAELWSASASAEVAVMLARN
jgi:hypothetical protein